MSWIETARITTKEIKEKREGTLVVQEAEELAQTIDCEKSELSEKRSALLYQLRKGQSWLLDQHSRWQSADTTSADDAEFSRVWNGWWELDHQLRTDHGFQGCIYGPDGACPDGFPCQGCTDILTSNIVVQLELT